MDSLSNVPEYSVGDLAGAIKGVLRENFGRVRVRGEITECKRYPSGHINLSIKDSEAKITYCPTERMWATVLTKPIQGAQFQLEAGMLSSWQ